MGKFEVNKGNQLSSSVPLFLLKIQFREKLVETLYRRQENLGLSYVFS